MAEETEHVSIWKTSRRGLGKRHLLEGYDSEDFPGSMGARPDGCAYFARDQWIAAEFVATSMSGYEDFTIEVRIPHSDYKSHFRQYEQLVTLGGRTGIELPVPATQLDELNRVGVRSSVDLNGDPLHVE
ncbi:MAG: hypothetical protein KDA52_23020 [Planctomycetaceae bacterium]|nr:hypothetical protein [Planctomycetaceae bacterium]